jgi:FKBP-type peptidyl-prolyl cis-trans isomerase FklB
MRIRYNRWTVVVALLLMVVAPVMVACSENDATVEEFADWKQKNDTHWASLMATTKQKVAGGDTSWMILPAWSLENQTPYQSGSKLVYDDTDYIIVHVLNEGTGGETPLYTDTVNVHYQGRMIPSLTYTGGFIFDSSWSGEYNLKTMHPSKFAVSTVIDGFATALMKMHAGDRWMVYMPYKLGYGESSPSSSSSSYGGITTTSQTASSTVPSIQPYSDLIFDITLADFHHPGKK